MDKLFPNMCSKPEKGKLFAIIPCWVMVIVLIPMYMPYLGDGIWQDRFMSSWLDIVYHVATGLVMYWFMSSYLKDEWFMLTTNVRSYMKHIALTVGLMLGAVVLLLGALFLFGFNIMYVLEALPLDPMSVSHAPSSLVSVSPIFGTIALSVFAPISICVLFYSFGFAPVCYKNTGLAYLSIAFVTMLPHIVDYLWRGGTVYLMIAYLIRLPIHLLACWSYQKTDNAWTPIFSLAFTNLVISLGEIFIIFR